MSAPRQRPTCPICARSIDAHSLEEIRACSAEAGKREPPYCRLTGPTKAQLELWRRR